MKIFLYNLMLITAMIVIWAVIFPIWAIGEVFQTIKNKK